MLQTGKPPPRKVVQNKQRGNIFTRLYSFGSMLTFTWCHIWLPAAKMSENVSIFGFMHQQYRQQQQCAKQELVTLPASQFASFSACESWSLFFAPFPFAPTILAAAAAEVCTVQRKNWLHCRLGLTPFSKLLPRESTVWRIANILSEVFCCRHILDSVIDLLKLLWSHNKPFFSEKTCFSVSVKRLLVSISRPVSLITVKDR